jgi:pSer/pThr/pTyr-binding forkhead associated (FHA) protein
MNDFAISRSHAIVELRGEDYYLKDLGSSNGTYVNGKLIEDRGTLLRDGDAVRFARYDFIFLSVEGLFELLRKRSVAAIDSAP